MVPPEKGRLFGGIFPYFRTPYQRGLSELSGLTPKGELGGKSPEIGGRIWRLNAGIDIQTYYNWSRDNLVFFEAISRAKQRGKVLPVFHYETKGN